MVSLSNEITKPGRSRHYSRRRLLVLICIGGLSYRSAIRDEEDRDWVNRTSIVLELLDAIAATMTDAETEQRGYLLTGDSFYLKPREKDAAIFSHHLQQLRLLIADNPA
jgi:CHASE3 domain sensor protein